jgi:hypothetical protein
MKLLFFLFTLVNSQQVYLVPQFATIPTIVTAGNTQCNSACPVGYDQARPILSWTGIPASNTLIVIPSATPLFYGDTRIGEFGDLFGAPNQLEKSLSDAGFTSTFITGSTASGGVGDHCSDGTFGQGYSSTAPGVATIGSNAALINPLVGGGGFPCGFLVFQVYWFCACFDSTSKPTKNPTKSPTKNPTKNPTTKPTINPTINPTQNPTLYGVRLRRVKLEKGTQIELSSAIQYDGRPTKITLPPTTTLKEIKWLNVNWTLLGVDQPTINECNPIPTVPIGVVTAGRCPCVDICISSPGVGVPLKFTTLRCCITNYTEIIIGEVSATSSMLVINANISTPDVQQTESFGIIRCNSAIERELNCQFQRQSTLYKPQCTNERIKCFQNETIGYGFGLFWNQNPLYPYYIPIKDWTEGQYRGIASVINNLVYSRAGELVDPLNWKRIVEYYWLVNFTATNSTFPTYQLLNIPDVLQAEPTNWLLDLPFTSSLPYQTCLNNLQSGSTTGCSILTWDTISEFYFKLPGTWLILNLTMGEVVQQFELTSSIEWSGVELYLGDVMIYQNLTHSLNYILPSQREGKLYSIRLLGRESIWDIPSAQLSSSLPLVPDSLWSSVQMYSYQFPFFPLVTTQGSFLGTINGKEGDFPFKNQSIPFVLGLEMFFSLSNTIWANLTDQILINNIYPPNLPLQLVESEYNTRPVNLTTDKTYLEKIWQAHLAPRQATEEFQCRTFDLGGLDFYQLEPLATQRWYAADSIYSLPPGSREGGCLCDPFYSPLQFCVSCLVGLGGLDCRLPYQLDPVPGGGEGVCSTHGQPLIEELKINFNLPTYNGLFPLCLELLYRDSVYYLSNGGQGVGFNFINGPDQIFITSNAIYINLQLTPATIIQSQPTIWATPLGLVECGGGFWQNDYYFINYTSIEVVNSIMGRVFTI